MGFLLFFLNLNTLREADKQKKPTCNSTSPQMSAIIYSHYLTSLGTKQHLLPLENNYHSFPLTRLSWLAYTAPFLAGDSQSSTDVAFGGNTFHIPLQFKRRGFLWLKKAVVNGYCQHQETRGKLINSQNLIALLYFHSLCNSQNVPPSLLACDFQFGRCIQKLEQNSWLVLFIPLCVVFIGSFILEMFQRISKLYDRER